MRLHSLPDLDMNEILDINPCVTLKKVRVEINNGADLSFRGNLIIGSHTCNKFIVTEFKFNLQNSRKALPVNVILQTHIFIGYTAVWLRKLPPIAKVIPCIDGQQDHLPP